MNKKTIILPDMPMGGAYAHATEACGLIFTAGQIPMDSITGQLVTGDFRKEVHQVFINLKRVLAEAGTDLTKVVKGTVFLTDMNNFATMNEVWAEYFPTEDVRPARSSVAVTALPNGARIEIELIAGQ